MALSCGKIITIGHDDNNYLNVLYEDSYSSSRTFHQRKTYYLCQANDIGCLKKNINLGTKDFSFFFVDFDAIKIKFCNSSIVVFDRNSLSVMKAFSLVKAFSYSGCVGNLPSSTFFPKDICTDQDGNFIVIDSYDNTVHFLYRRGEFVQLIMSAEDGLQGITYVALDNSGLLTLWLGCMDGIVFFADYDYLKNTSREERRLKKRRK